MFQKELIEQMGKDATRLRSVQNRQTDDGLFLKCFGLRFGYVKNST